MLQRSSFPKQKDVIIINDVPVNSEIKEGEKFSAVSNMGLLTALRKGTIYPENKIEGHKGIISTKIHTTYLDYSYFAEDNNNFKRELKKRKDLLRFKGTDTFYLKELEDLPGEKEKYILIPHQKDGYIAERLYNSFLSLLEEIKKVDPKFIIITGKWTLFLLCGVSSIADNMPKPGDLKPLGAMLKYRNSIMSIHSCWNIPDIIVNPIIHPVHAWGMQDKIPIIEIDLLMAGWKYNTIMEKGVDYFLKPDIDTILGTTLSTVKSYFQELKAKLDQNPVYVVCDIETLLESSVIDCIGFSYEVTRGLCIPFYTLNTPTWFNKNQELEILLMMKDVLEHPNIRLIYHNGAYDLQVKYRLWGLVLNLAEDTMVSAHILNNKLPKSLVFQSSIHCEKYSYWKDEVSLSHDNYQARWIYNIKDCCNTLEVFLAHKENLENYPDERLNKLYRRQVDKLHPLLLKTMYRGIRMDRERKEALFNFYESLLIQIPDKITEMLGFAFNPNSPQQKKKLFKEYFNMELISKQRKGKEDAETCDAAAMKLYMEQYPLYKPFLTLLIEYTALSKFTKTFLGMKLDWDDRARTQYKITGTAFGRLSSTKNVYGNGCMPVNEVEAYTPNGWISIADKPKYIAQYSLDGTLEFVEADWLHYNYDGELYCYNGRNFRGNFTEDHRLLTITSKGYPQVYNPIKVSSLKFVNIPVTGILETKESDSVSDAWLIKEILLSADGSFETSNNWRVSFKKERKKERLEKLFPDLKQHKCKEGYNRYVIPDKGYTKILPIWFLNLPIRQRVLIIEEIKHWDGHIRGNSYLYFTTIPENADLLQTLCHISGYSASINIDLTNSNEHGNTSTKPLYTVNVSKKQTNLSEGFRWTKKRYNGIVGCPKVPSSYWLVRSKGGIHITGNCNFQNLPEKGKIQIHYLLELLGMRNNDSEEDIDGLLALSEEELDYVE